MKKRIVVNEFDLMRWVRCPLYLARNGYTQEPADIAAVSAAAEDLLRWITRQAFEYTIPDLNDVRGRADAFFRKYYTGTMTLSVARRLIRISRRLHELVLLNDVLWPAGSYELDFGDARIEGTVTVVKSNSKLSLPPRIIRLRNHTIKPPVIPDIVSLARWLFGQRESGYSTCVVYNYSLTGDTTSSDTFTESSAQTMLNSAVNNWIGNRLYPIPGNHCWGCQQPCLSLKA